MKKVIVVIISLILLQLCKYGLTQSFYNDYGKRRGELYLEEGDHEVIDKAYDYLMTALNIIPIKTKKTDVFYKETAPVKAIGTNHLFSQIEPFKMTHGSFLSKGALWEARNVVVISEALSQKLYNTSNSVGNSCIIEGLTYEVVGVYKKYANLYQYFQDDGVEKVYIPYSNKLLKEVGFESIIFTEWDSKWKVKISSFPRALYGYHYLVLFVVGGLIIKKWFIYSFQKGKRYVMALKKTLESDYLKAVLLKEYKNVLMHVWRIGLGTFMIWALWYGITFKGNMLNESMGITKALQQYNFALNYLATTFNRSYLYLKTCLICISLLQLYVGFKGFKTNKKEC